MSINGYRTQAMDILQDIPEDKVVHVLELLKAFRLLYNQVNMLPKEQENFPSSLGILSAYANESLIPLEKNAWGAAVAEKHNAG